jgi:hypothetical protein
MVASVLYRPSAHPPLSAAPTSPPQGGRVATAALPVKIDAAATARHQRRSPRSATFRSPPLCGRCPAGQRGVTRFSAASPAGQRGVTQFSAATPTGQRRVPQTRSANSSTEAPR